MYISKMQIRNFRNFSNGVFVFGQGVNTLIGENGSGKSNAFHALRLLIDDSMPRSSVRLEETDFNRNLNRWQGHWIIIALEFKGQLDDEFAQALVNHAFSNGQTATLNLYFRPKIEVRSKLHEFSTVHDVEQRAIQINDYLSKLTLNEYEAAIHGRSSADFCSEQTYESVVGRFDEYMFPDPSAEDSALVGTPISLGYRPEFSCTFAKALRDVINDLRNSRTSPLLRLLNAIQIQPNEILEITEKIADLNSEIQQLPQISQLAEDISSSLRKTAGYTYTPDIGISANVSSDMNHVFRSLRLQAGEYSDEPYAGDLSEISLGGANLIYLALKLEEYRRLDHMTKKVAHFLLVEEPEAHLHSHIQKTLFQKYHDQETDTQVFLSTHSSHISSSCDLDKVNVLQLHGTRTQVSQPANRLLENEKRNLERYLDATRAALLFARAVILVEGDAEEILIPFLVKSVFGLSLDELGISLINVGSTQFKNIAVVFDESRLKRRCAIITDHDISIVPLGAPTDDDDYQKKCRNSQTAGVERKRKLDEFCRNNPFVQPFYARYTFEVDFLIAGNQSIYQQIVEEIYTQERTIAESKDKIDDSSIAVSGREVLRLADKVGKGWLAIEATNFVSTNTAIPDYILDALSFVSELHPNLVKTMMRHNLGDTEFHRISEAIGDVEPEEFVRQYYTHNPQTPIGRLCRHMVERQRDDD